MRVIAIEKGFYGGARRRVGSEFEFADSDLRDGKLPKWVVPASPENRAAQAAAVAKDRNRQLDALRATAGPKRAGTQGVREVNTGLATAVGVSDPARLPQVKYPQFDAPVPAAPERTVEMVPAEPPSLF